MTVAAMHQSQYIPWPPYFKKLAAADVFVLMDSVQYQKNGLQNRNKVRDKNGDFWLTIPVTGTLTDTIAEKPLASGGWREKHWKSLVSAYARAPFWDAYKDGLQALFARDYATLGQANESFFFFMIDGLGLKTKVVRLSELKVGGAKTDLVVAACKAVGATTYLSGTGAKDYLDESAFARDGIRLEYLESAPPSYAQFHGEPIPGLSMLDMMFNAGPDAVRGYLARSAS